jgi:hypothetical protein
LPFDEQPVLEDGIMNCDAVEQIAAVERDRLLDALRGACAHQPLEGAHIRAHGRRIEPDRLPVGDDPRRIGRLQALAQAVEGVLQAVPRLRIAAVAP